MGRVERNDVLQHVVTFQYLIQIQIKRRKKQRDQRVLFTFRLRSC